ncbi:MAG: imidazoleglycerol-phosphate dehydratase [Syntrophotaleaceae bacterium]
MPRSATIDRQTAETQIHLTLSLDGSGRGDIATSVPFSTTCWCCSPGTAFSISKSEPKGCAGRCAPHRRRSGYLSRRSLQKAIGDKQGLRRYGRCTMPMHEALATVDIDFSGRPHLVFNLDLPKAKVGDFDVELTEEFFVAFCNHAGANLHVNLAYGSNLHHIIEAVFKAFGRALDEATGRDGRVVGVMSSKGKLE